METGKYLEIQYDCSYWTVLDVEMIIKMFKINFLLIIYNEILLIFFLIIGLAILSLPRRNAQKETSETL